MWATRGDGLFQHYYGLWTHILVKNIWMMDLFLTNTQVLSSQDINWWTGVVWTTCDVFISCLDSHSDGTHSLQRIHWWASDAMLHFSKSDEETNSSTSWMAWEWAHFQKMFIFGHCFKASVYKHFVNSSNVQHTCLFFRIKQTLSKYMSQMICKLIICSK